jgi:hypothetical protein
MKNQRKIRRFIWAVALGISPLLAIQAGHAQGIDSTAHKVGKKIEKTSKKVGDKSASVAVKGASAVTDKVYKGKEGPEGQTIYIDKKDKKYYVDEKGKKVYLKESEIRDKQETGDENQ